MTTTENEPTGAAIPEPESWEWKEVFTHLLKELFGRQMIRGSQMPVERIQYQVENDQTINAIGSKWSELDASARQKAWPDLIQAGYDATKEMLPVCVRCGECCLSSSPTLYAEDLELVHGKLLPPEMLVTLRQGEPVRSPFQTEPFHLKEECIKIREKPGAKGCVFYDAKEKACGVYQNRPLQCRAQACWDPSVGEELARETKLTRKDVFASLEDLTTLLAEHDNRCSFAQLREAFDELEETKGESIDAVIDAVAFEDHFRHFVAEQINLPRESLDFFFGRSFVDLVRLFGFTVEEEADGTKILKPVETKQ